MDKVCVVGLGIIGRIWADHYASDGRAVTSWNRTPRPDAPGFVGELQAAVADADVIHVCVADPPAVRAVLAQAIPSLKAGCLIIQSSTISPSAAKEFSALALSHGMRYVEAPFTGSKPAAEGRQLVYFLGGGEEECGAAARWLAKLSRKQFHFSTVEKAAAIKLAMNLQIAAVSQAMLEGLHLARSYGLSTADFFEVLDLNVARSGLVDLKKEKILGKDYSPQFSVKHMAKDLKLALESAGESALKLTERTSTLFEHAILQGLADEDFIALEKLLELS